MKRPYTLKTKRDYAPSERGSWQHEARLTIENQTFTLARCNTRQEARWWCEQMAIALEKLRAAK